MNECPSCGAAGMRDRTHACMTAGRIQPARRRYQTCPKCNGQKVVNTPPWVAGDQHTYPAIHTGSYQCPVCNGLGMVEEPS